MSESGWIELPGLFDEHTLGLLSEALSEADVEHETRAIPLGPTPGDGRQGHMVRVAGGHVRPAARVLGELFEVEDPDAARPFHGPCPACEEPVDHAWVCPSCELSFKSHVNPNDPLVVFLREHDGFLQPEDRGMERGDDGDDG